MGEQLRNHVYRGTLATSMLFYLQDPTFLPRLGNFTWDKYQSKKDPEPIVPSVPVQAVQSAIPTPNVLVPNLNLDLKQNDLTLPLSTPLAMSALSDTTNDETEELGEDEEWVYVDEDEEE